MQIEKLCFKLINVNRSGQHIVDFKIFSFSIINFKNLFSDGKKIVYGYAKNNIIQINKQTKTFIDTSTCCKL